MGRGKSWSREESEAVAKAWKSAIIEIPSMKEQNTKLFSAVLYKRFIEYAPKTDKQSSEGRWEHRSQTAVKTQFDAIGDDILRFNHKHFIVVQRAADFGLKSNDQNVLRAAIAFHLGNANSSTLDFEHIDTVEADWKLYEAWCVLKSCPRFVPHHLPAIHQQFQSAVIGDNNTSLKNHTASNNSNSQNNSNELHHPHHPDDSDDSLPPPPPTKHTAVPSTTINPLNGSRVGLMASGGPPVALREAMRRSSGLNTIGTNQNITTVDSVTTTPGIIVKHESLLSSGPLSTDGGTNPSGSTPMKTLARAALAMPRQPSAGDRHRLGEHHRNDNQSSEEAVAGDDVDNNKDDEDREGEADGDRTGDGDEDGGGERDGNVNENGNDNGAIEGEGERGRNRGRDREKDRDRDRERRRERPREDGVEDNNRNNNDNLNTASPTKPKKRRTRSKGGFMLTGSAMGTADGSRYPKPKKPRHSYPAYDAYNRHYRHTQQRYTPSSHPNYQQQTTQVSSDDHPEDGVDYHTGYPVDDQGETSSQQHQLANGHYYDHEEKQEKQQRYHNYHPVSSYKPQKYGRSLSTNAPPISSSGLHKKYPKSIPSNQINFNSGAMHLIEQTLKTLGDALSEHNAIMLFSRPDMQDKQERKEFFDTLAQKHVLKARLERDELEREIKRSKEKEDRQKAATD